MRAPSVAVVAYLAAGTIGCARSADQIAAIHISPVQYKACSCRQIVEEAQWVSALAAQVIGPPGEKATRDAVVPTVGLVVFCPTLFLIGGND